MTLTCRWLGFGVKLILGVHIDSRRYGPLPQVKSHKESTMVAAANEETVFVGLGLLELTVRPKETGNKLQSNFVDCDVEMEIDKRPGA